MVQRIKATFPFQTKKGLLKELEGDAAKRVYQIREEFPVVCFGFPLVLCFLIFLSKVTTVRR